MMMIVFKSRILYIGTVPRFSYFLYVLESTMVKITQLR